MQKTLHGIKLECVQGNIIRQPDMKAVVNAANAQLLPGGGVAGAIHHAAGPGLVKECQPLAPIEPGQAVITGGHNLPNRYVIHCLGPVYGQDTPSDTLLAACYQNALELADAREIDSLAFPSISTGAFRYPLEEAATVATRTIIDTLPKLHHLKRVRFVLFSEGDREVYAQALAEVEEDS